MPLYEYKVIPAPARGVKAKGVKRPEDRFALALSQMMNAEARDGWEYIRTDILPATERSGLTRTQTVYHNLLVFRREILEGEGAQSDGPLQIGFDDAHPPFEETDVEEAPEDLSPDDLSSAPSEPEPETEEAPEEAPHRALKPE